MNSIKHRFTLDMHSVQSQISIPASLYDTARTLYINFTDGGDPYHISEGCTALLIISKPSGAELCEWCAIKDNTNVVYPFSQNKNTASEEGICECEITLYSAPDEDGEIEQIASPRFSIVVSERAINRGDDEVLPEASIGFIDQAVKDELVRRQNEEGRVAAENARVSAETARVGAETARANAESARATAETERASAESARKTAENARASAETARASAETQRIASEEERQRKAAEYKAQVDLVREEISTWQDEWGKISSFDKRIENLEAAVSPGLVTPTVDSTVAYRKTVPKGVLPNAAVCEVGGMSYRCENLIPFPYGDTTVTRNGITWTVNADGSVTANGTATSDSNFNLKKYSYDDFIKLNVGEAYTLSGYPSSGLGKGYIIIQDTSYKQDALTEGTATTFTPKYNSYYMQIKISAGKTVSNLVIRPMLNKGTTALPYQPYFEGLRDSKVTAVESEGTNLIPYTPRTVTHNGITYTVNADGSVTANGTATNQSFFFIRNNSLLAKGTYTLSGCPSGGNGSTYCLYAVLDNTDYSTIKGDMGNGTSFTLNEDRELAIHINIVKGVTVRNLTFKPMLNRGSTALPFAPYAKHTFPIPEAVQALEGYGLGVNKDYYNKVVIDPDNFVKKYVKIVNKLEWNGTENMSAQNYAAHFTVQQFNISGPSDIKNGIDVLCNETTSGWNAFTGNANEIGVSSGYIVIGIPKALLTPYGYVDGTSSTYVSSFKAYLKAKYDNGTPITVAYAIATPVETDVSTLFADDNLLPVEAGGTITAVNEFEHEVPFTIEYTVKGA